MQPTAASIRSPEVLAPSPAPRKRACFLDRDGVLNRDRQYVARREDFEFLPGVFAALRAIAERGYLLIVVTNQSGIGRGYYTSEDFARLTEWMRAELAREGITLTAVYHCPHAPEANCDCRKPAPGMLLQAAQEYALDLERCWLVGDKLSDLEAAHRAGVPHTVLIRGRPAEEAAADPAQRICDSLAEVPDCIALDEALT